MLDAKEKASKSSRYLYRGGKWIELDIMGLYIFVFVFVFAFAFLCFLIVCLKYGFVMEIKRRPGAVNSVFTQERDYLLFFSSARGMCIKHYRYDSLMH